MICIPFVFAENVTYLYNSVYHYACTVAMRRPWQVCWFKFYTIISMTVNGVLFFISHIMLFNIIYITDNEWSYIYQESLFQKNILQFYFNLLANLLYIQNLFLLISFTYKSGRFSATKNIEKSLCELYIYTGNLWLYY